MEMEVCFTSQINNYNFVEIQSVYIPYLYGSGFDICKKNPGSARLDSRFVYFRVWNITRLGFKINFHVDTIENQNARKLVYYVLLRAPSVTRKTRQINLQLKRRSSALI